MKIIVFLGPTMPVHEARMILDAVYLRPAKQGDLLSCVTSMEPDVIALIDGYFYQEQSVWHKEIIFALSKGVAVYGSSAHISQTERTELKTATRISFPQPVVGRRF